MYFFLRALLAANSADVSWLAGRKLSSTWLASAVGKVAFCSVSADVAGVSAA